MLECVIKIPQGFLGSSFRDFVEPRYATQFGWRMFENNDFAVQVNRRRTLSTCLSLFLLPSQAKVISPSCDSCVSEQRPGLPSIRIKLCLKRSHFCAASSARCARFQAARFILGNS